ncbi:MAG: hypothetical protein ACREAC_22525 [Blastocatellia bacterium]
MSVNRRFCSHRLSDFSLSHFIRSKQVEGERYKYVVLVHPTITVQRLRAAGKMEFTTSRFQIISL